MQGSISLCNGDILRICTLNQQQMHQFKIILFQAYLQWYFRVGSNPIWQSWYEGHENIRG